MTYDITSGEKVVSGEELIKAAGKESPFATAEIGLIAEWSINSYKVTYSNGSDTHVEESHEFGSKITLKAADTFTKEGYFFTKWQDKRTSLTYDVNSQFTLSEARDYEFAPVWEKASFTLKFNANKPATESNIENNVADEKLLFDTEFTLPQGVYTLTGYTFLTWNTSSDGKG